MQHLVYDLLPNFLPNFETFWVFLPSFQPFSASGQWLHLHQEPPQKLPLLTERRVTLLPLLVPAVTGDGALARPLDSPTTTLFWPSFSFFSVADYKFNKQEPA